MVFQNKSISGGRRGSQSAASERAGKWDESGAGLNRIVTLMGLDDDSLSVIGVYVL